MPGKGGSSRGACIKLHMSSLLQEALLFGQSPPLAPSPALATPVDTCSENRPDLPWKGKASAANHVLMPIRQVVIQQASDEVRKITQGIKMFL